MSDFVCLHDKAVIWDFLQKDTDLHLYELGDLDDLFWPHTIWFGRPEQDRLTAVALLYLGLSHPTFLALGPTPPLLDLVRNIADYLPHWFYAHLSPGVEEPTFRVPFPALLNISRHMASGSAFGANV